MCPIFRKAPLLDLTIKEVNWPSLPLRHHGLMDKDGVTDGMGEKKGKYPRKLIPRNRGIVVQHVFCFNVCNQNIL